MKRSNKGIEIEGIVPGSVSNKAGIRAGDILLSMNGSKISDEVDYMFHAVGGPMTLELLREGKSKVFNFITEEGEDAGIELKQSKIKTCKNNCIFCFVSQLPKGLRKSLYVKDEDYRMSFLYGNYITLTNLTEEDKKRIVEQRLSPLYISVHTTDPELRKKMLGNNIAPDVMKELRFLRDNKIRMHVQIVLCPGYNDGIELQKTICNLHSFYPYLESIAVVPVGLTEHRKLKLRPIEKDDAEKCLDMIESLRKRFMKKYGDPVIYAADELYIKAGKPFPPLKEYGELPQLENGVGMVPLFMSRAKSIKPQVFVEEHPSVLKKKYLTVTGTSFAPYFQKFIERLNKAGVQITLVPVKNYFFGNSVTVTGLLTGRDIIRALMEKTEGYDLLLLPDVVLRDDADMMLDNITPGDIEEALKIRVAVIESNPEGLLKGISAI